MSTFDSIVITLIGGALVLAGMVVGAWIARRR